MVKVRLVSWNTGPPLALLAIKTSAGKVKEKGIDYYLKEYPSEKREELLEWLKKASKGFPSVLEHIVLTFMIEDVSRILTHQLVRHRIASYTQESQRYSIQLDRKDAEKLLQTNDHNIETKMRMIEKYFVIPQTIRKDKATLEAYVETLYETLKIYHNLTTKGVPLEDARFILPQSIKTRILMTVNLRELLHIISLRKTKKAQWEIRELVQKMLNEARRVFPEIEQLIENHKLEKNE